MDAVIRALALYVLLLVLFRLTGRRTLAEATTFDFVLLLIVGKATQQALLGEDFSLTNAAIVVTTLIAADIGLSLVATRSPLLQKLAEDTPVILVNDGRLLEDRLKKSRVSEDDILEAARELQGLANLEQVRYAVLERSGGITIVPK